MQQESKKESCGYLYIACGKKYITEAEISARSLRRFTQHPICIVTDDAAYINSLFDAVVYINETSDFVSKIIGLPCTPYQRTIFLDTDTFVCSNIDNLFTCLDVFDMSLSTDPYIHSYSFLHKYNPSFQLAYEKVIPQYNTGVIVYKINDGVIKLFHDWLILHRQMNVKANMPSFREAFIANAAAVRIIPLPNEYNFTGIKSFAIAFSEIKVLHERLAEKKGTLTAYMQSFDEMDKFTRRLNRYPYKRIIIPYFGAIPYTWSPFMIKARIRKFFGVKKHRKSESS